MLCHIGLRQETANPSKILNKTSGRGQKKEHPYEIAVRPSGASVVVGVGYSERDLNTGKIAYEDLITYLLAYAEQQSSFKQGTANVAAAVKKVKNIGRMEIVNKQTVDIIDEFFKVNKLIQGNAFHDVGTNSKCWKALIASNNGSLAPKFLGTNMATFESGSIGTMWVRKDEKQDDDDFGSSFDVRWEAEDWQGQEIWRSYLLHGDGARP